MWIIQKLSRVFGFSVYSIRIVGNVFTSQSVFLSGLFEVMMCGMLMLETHCHIRACDVTSFAHPDWLLMLSDWVESVRLCFEYYIFDSNIWIYGQGVCVNHIRLRWSNIFLVFFFVVFLSSSLIFLFRMKEIYIVYINVHPLHLFFLCVCVFYVHYFLPGQFGTTAQYKQYFFSNYLLN